MKNDSAKAFTIGLTSLLLIPSLAQAIVPPPLNGAKNLVNGVKKTTTKKITQTVKSLAEKAVKEDATQYIQATYKAEVPTEHFLAGSQATEDAARIFRPIYGDIVDLQVEKAVLATGNDAFITLDNQVKILDTRPGDVILQPVLLPYPILMKQENYATLYKPVDGMPGLVLRQGNAPMPVKVSYITRDWTPAPTRFLRNPSTYRKGDFVVSFYGGLLRRTVPPEDLATYFRGQNVSLSSTNILFRALGPQNALKFLGIPTGTPARYVKKDRIQASPAEEPGEGGYKPTDLPQTFVQIYSELKLKVSWGEQYLGPGSFLNITNPEDVYGVTKEEFEETYQLFR